MIKSEMRQGSAPPVSSLTLTKYPQMYNEDLWQTNQKNTYDIGPWNAHNEQVSQYLDTELSLSKYNRGFNLKIIRSPKKKAFRKKKKRSQSQMEQNQSLKTSSEDLFLANHDQQKYLNVKRMSQQHDENEINLDCLNIESKIIMLNNPPNNNQQVYNDNNNKFLSAEVLRQPYKIRPQLKRNTRVNSNIQDDSLPYVIKTEQSSSQIPSPPLITIYSQEANKFLSNQLNNKPKHQMRIPQKETQLIHVDEYKNERIVSQPKSTCNHLEEDTHRQQDCYHQVKDNLDKLNGNLSVNNQSKDISTQSHSIDNHIQINKDTKNSYTCSSSSLSSSECAKNKEYEETIKLSRIKGVSQHIHPQTNRKQNISSMHSTPMVSSPQKIGHLFQISASHYYQENQSQNNNNNIGRRLKTEDMYQKSNLEYQQQYQQIPQTRISSQQKQYEYPSQQIKQVNNQFCAQFSPITPISTQDEDGDKLHATQNHLRVSHYQSNKNQNIQQQQASSSINEKQGRMILREIVLATNNNKISKEIGRYTKNFNFRVDNQEKVLSQIKNSTFQQRRNILQNCLADCKQQNQNQQQQSEAQSFLTSQNPIVKTIYKGQNTQCMIKHSEDIQIKQMPYNLDSCNDSNNKQISKQVDNPIIIYRRAQCSRNQLTFNNNLSTNQPLNQSRRSQECIGDNTRSLFRVSQQQTQIKMLTQFSPQKSKSRRGSCSPQQNYGQRENLKQVKKIIIESNQLRIKNLQELHQPVKLVNNDTPNYPYFLLPKINTEIHTHHQ